MLSAVSVLCASCVLIVQDAHAQVAEDRSVVQYYEVASTSPAGTVIVWDSAREALRPAVAPLQEEERVFGIVVADPSFYFQANPASTSSEPIARRGQVAVRVTDAAGSIERGDKLSVSPYSGVGQLRTNGNATIGVAQAPFPSEAATSATTTIDGQALLVGQIPVVLQATIDEFQEREAGEEELFDIANVREVTLLNVLQYLAATAVAVGAMYISFRNFGGSLREAIASIGRNPRAKSAIRRTVLYNAALIVLTTLLGLFVSFAIISLSLV